MKNASEIFSGLPDGSEFVDGTVLDSLDGERFCSNCIYELPSCAMDMNHGTRCRFHKMDTEADGGQLNG